MPLAILILSIIVQFCAAGLALVPMRRTGHIRAWSFVAGALCLMGVRRTASLVHALTVDDWTIDPIAESIALLTSILMLVGVKLIAGFFEEAHRSHVNAENEVEKRRRAEAELRDSLRRAEEVADRLRESEERLRFLSDNLPDGMVYQVDSGVDGRQRRFTYVSGGIEQLHEFTAAEALADAMRVYRQVSEDDIRTVTEREQKAVESMTPFRAEVRVELPSGKTRWRLFASAPRRLPNNHLIWDGLEIDITDRKLAEEEQRRMETLESLGTTAGGIAHDFNNLLMGVFGNLELGKLELAPDHPAFASLQAAYKSLDNARQLTTRLLTFAKGGLPVLESLDIRGRIRDTVQFNLTGSNVAPHFDIPDDLWPVKADKGQFAQVISNLTINAREAMPTGGTLYVQARNIPDLRELAAPELHGAFVRLSIRDEGVGIPARIINRIFDPYFTTKQAGSGLGLAVTHGIVSRHKGYIRVDSTPDVGTTMTVFLPVNTVERTRAATEQASLAAPPVRTPGSVLLMDDEETVLKVTSRMLTRSGHTVETAVNGRQALDKYAAALNSGRRFDVTIMDLTIPGGMGGKEAIRELLAMDPTARVIVSSGYSSDPVLAECTKHGFAGSLAKPFKLQELEEAVAHAMRTK